MDSSRDSISRKAITEGASSTMRTRFLSLSESTTSKMAQPKSVETGESSASAAQNQLKANANGVANYELPW
jgi:hypothetical protein